MSQVLIIAATCLGCLLAVVLTALRLPGTWLIVGGAALYGWFTQWRAVTLTTLLVLAGIAAAGEVVELIASMVTSRRAGGSRRAAWGGLIGGLLGILFLSVPLPVVGSVIGALAGCFLGAAIGELTVRSHLLHGTRVGLWAAMGFAIGVAAKVGLALVMSIIVVISVANLE